MTTSDESEKNVADLENRLTSLIEKNKEELKKVIKKEWAKESSLELLKYRMIEEIKKEQKKFTITFISIAVGILGLTGVSAYYNLLDIFEERMEKKVLIFKNIEINEVINQIDKLKLTGDSISKNFLSDTSYKAAFAGWKIEVISFLNLSHCADSTYIDAIHSIHKIYGDDDYAASISQTNSNLAAIISNLETKKKPVK